MISIKYLFLLFVAVSAFALGSYMGYDSGVRDTHSFMEGTCVVSSLSARHRHPTEGQRNARLTRKTASARIVTSKTATRTTS